ncbi:TIM-barrel domain-containing protein [Alloiococcus sp. CFN-8]|uniref:glycoside hydrolase family 31 protein n=1 Tax=Alloiococcus sp. CFN-8 TaxID=3416081 RepID=UPI003CEDBD9C
MKICKEFKGMETREGISIIHTNCADISITFVTEEIVRVRASFDREMDEASYVLSTTAWEDRLDGLFQGERSQKKPVAPAVEEKDGKVVFTTEAIKLELTKEPFCFRLYDKEGTLLYSDLEGSPYILDSNNRVNHYSQMQGEEECYYGFGEKGGELNKNKTFIRERATDAMGYDSRKMDTLYKHIPFYIRMNRSTHKAVGLFYHNFYESVFNMGCEKSNYWCRYTYWQADGGDVDLFLIGGNTLKRIVDNYTLITGRPALLPKRALGYQGSSMYYPELEKDSDDAVISFIDTIKEEGFPIDGFHLSSGYTSYENLRCVFTWNKTRFKDPKAYFAAMNDRGAQNVPNVKPGILLDHPWFDEFKSKDVFVKASEGEGFVTGRWWGGEGAFWDLTKESARRTWKDYLIENVIKVGTNSIWNDNCEYDSILDKDAICDYDGKGGTIGQLKPLMSTIMCKLAADAVKENDENARPYVVCRSGSSGIQKYAQTWCGDNYTSWDSLKYNIPIITGMGLSGQPNEGADIGGFAGPAPGEELFVRWVQNGIFQPRFSIHSASNDNTVTEPWMYSGSKDIIRDAILLRYRMTPYLYSLEYEASETGAPIMRALVYEFQNDPKVFDESFEFMFGRDILVANVLEPGATTQKVYLPAGCKWYDWNNNFACYEGGQTIEVPVTLETIPMFIREGAIIPMAKNQLMSMERDHMTKLHLTLAPGIENTYTLYDDDGVTNNFKKGEFRKTHITMEGKDVVKVHFASEGSYEDFVEDVTVEMIRKDKSPYWVTLGDSKLEHFLNRRKFEAAEEGWYYSQTKKAVEVKYKNPKKDVVLTVSFEDFDLIGM